MRRLALLGAFLAPASCELSSAYLYDYAFHKSTQEALDYNLNVLWKMGEVMATGMATDLVYNASGPGDLHGRLRSGDGTLSLLVYSLLIGESLATYMHYAGFEDSTWVGVYNAGNGGGPAGNYTFAVAANVSRDAGWWRVAVGACEPPDDAACAACCRSKWVTDARGAPAGDAFTTGYYDTRARPWYVAGLSARGPVWTEPYVYANGVTIGNSAVTPLDDGAGTRVGVHAVDVEFDSMSAYLRTMAASTADRDDVFFVVDAGGLFVALSTNATDLSIETPGGDLARRHMANATDERIRRAAAALADGAAENKLLIEDHWFVASAPLREAGLNWTLVYTYPVGCPAGSRESVELGCVPCADTWSSEPESVACGMCAAGYYLDGDACEACPSHFYCDEPGAELERLLVAEGYMRMSSKSTEALECAHRKSCPLADGRVTCDADRGATGPRCSVCDEGYFSDQVQRCHDCKDAFAASSPETLASILVSLLLLGGFLYLITLMTKPKSGNLRRAGKLCRLNQKLTVKWKIVFVASQILYTMPSMMPGTRFPTAYKSLYMAFDIVTLDLGAALPLQCLDLVGGGAAFYRALLAMTLGPGAFIVLAMSLAFAIHLVHGYVMSRGEVRRALISVTILVTYLLLPAVTTTIVRAFPCDEFDDPRGSDRRIPYLVADLSIRCDSTTHRTYMVYAALALFAWPVGVPLVTFFVLFHYRDHLNPVVDNESIGRRKARRSYDHRLDYLVLREQAQEARARDEKIQHLQLLYGPYEPEYFYWEVFEMLRRLMLTSGLLLVGDGPLVKVFFAIVVALATQKAYSYFAPYASDSDDVLAETLQWVTLFTFLATLACAVGQANVALTVGMIGLQVAGLVVVGWLMVADIKREKDALKTIGEEIRHLQDELSATQKVISRKRLSTFVLGRRASAGQPAATDDAPEAKDDGDGDDYAAGLSAPALEVAAGDEDERAVACSCAAVGGDESFAYFSPRSLVAPAYLSPRTNNAT